MFSLLYLAHQWHVATWRVCKCASWKIPWNTVSKDKVGWNNFVPLFLFHCSYFIIKFNIDKKPPTCLQMKKQLARGVLQQLFCMCDQEHYEILMKELNFQLNCRLEAYNIARHVFFKGIFQFFWWEEHSRWLLL